MSNKWYANGLKFQCTQCGHCCTGAPGYVWITLPELYRIAEFLEMDDHEFAKKYVRKVNQKMSLIELPNGDCVFYDKGCKIYPVRPTQCRTFPFWPEIIARKKTWDEAAEECPGMNSGELHTLEEIDKTVAENSE
jgi:uncharacterized protein